MNRKEFYNSLSEDVKAKLKNCKTEEEMMSVLDAEKIELAPELLDEASVAGGYCRHYFPCGGNCPGAVSC